MYPCYNDGFWDTEVIFVIYNDFDLTQVNDQLCKEGYFRGRVLHFNLSEARRQHFLASDWLDFDTLPRKYRTLYHALTSVYIVLITHHLSPGVQGDFSLDGGGAESGEETINCAEGQVPTSDGSSCGQSELFICCQFHYSQV